MKANEMIADDALELNRVFKFSQQLKTRLNGDLNQTGSLDHIQFTEIPRILDLLENEDEAAEKLLL